MKYMPPKVDIEEISLTPPPVAEVPTAIPAFIGFTKTAVKGAEDLTNKPTRITSLHEYEQYFGGQAPIYVTGTVDADDNYSVRLQITRLYMYESLRLFFDNHGGSCYVVSVGDYEDEISLERFKAGLTELEKFDEPTMILMPDAVRLDADDLYATQQLALAQCGRRRDRVALFDLPNDNLGDIVPEFREKIGTTDLKYGATYAPWIVTAYDKDVPWTVLQSLKDQHGERFEPLKMPASGPDSAKQISGLLSELQSQRRLPADAKSDRSAKRLEDTLYALNPAIGNLIRQIKLRMSEVPPCGGVAGVYAYVDSTRGVWKAPANVALSQVLAPVTEIDDATQADLQVDVVGGKSVNTVRSSPGRGVLVWGARTLAGNDNEWRYVNVRRFFNMVEESLQKSTLWAVFEPNAAPLWAKVKSHVENYLTQKWRDGALAGARPEDAFFVKVGLGQTMTAQDILEGRLNIEVGMAVVRPAEFTVLKLSYTMQVP